MLSACDYPEQGYFQLVAFDGYGEPVAVWPFAVEELVDDTEMTTGFRVLLPIEGELLELDLDDASDLARRAWTLWLNDWDYGLGDLDLTLSHAADRLGFTGAYRPPVVDTPEQLIPAPPAARAFGGYVVSRLDGAESELVFGGDPPAVPLAPGAVSWRVERITRDAFESVLGTPIDDAIRRLSTPRDALEPIEQQIPDEIPSQSAQDGDSGQQQAEDSAGEDDSNEDGEGDDSSDDQAGDADQQKEDERNRPKSPPLGGRGGSRPR